MSLAVKTAASQVASLLKRIAARGEAPALVEGDLVISAGDLIAKAGEWQRQLVAAGVTPGSICSFEGEYGAGSVSLMLALMAMDTIQVPFSTGAGVQRDELEREAFVEWRVDLRSGAIERRAACDGGRHQLVEQIVALGHPGLVVFTSGSSGRPKAILHDIDRVAGKFSAQRKPWRMMLMLLIDHFGGFNTLIGCLADGGVGICVADRSPAAVCEAIARDKAELLPTTPTFLSMLIASELWRRHDLTSLQLISYGAEPMPAATLARIGEILPQAKLKQTYGLSELGVLRSSSPEPGSLWLRVGGDEFETRVVDGLLHIRSQSNMLGYLNAPSPIDDDGWMNTGDLVEARDGLIRFLGRTSEVINVGGQKVLPSEVEGVLMEVEGVVEAVVTSVPHALLGNAVVANIALSAPEEPKLATERLREHCRQSLQKYKVPMRYEFVAASELMTDRAKKRRT